VVAGLNISPQAGIQMTKKQEKQKYLTQYLDPFLNSKCFFQMHILKALFTVISKMV